MSSVDKQDIFIDIYKIILII